MSGRGCTISIQLLGKVGSDEEIEELSLPVALHSPLEVLKEQLESYTGIPFSQQILVLLDLSDSERNSDVLLVDKDHMSLRNCGIRNGSILTLHPLGMSAEENYRMTKEALSKKKLRNLMVLKENTNAVVHKLNTPISAASADHSYNGIIFDIMSKGSDEVYITSISLAGMLGRIRIFARYCSWDIDKPERTVHHQWYSPSDSISPNGWIKVADVLCRPAWDRPVEIFLDEPFLIRPHCVHGFYCHSDLPDDLGIQYQSYHKDDIVAEDNTIAILPGLGHVGHRPFDDSNGRYRSYRGPSGTVSYTSRHKGWNMLEHSIFPRIVQEGIWTMLLAHNRQQVICSPPSTTTLIPTCKSKSGYFFSYPPAPSQLNTFLPDTAHPIGILPTHVLYTIFEFMSWEWFDEIYGEEYRAISQDTREWCDLWKETRNQPNLSATSLARCTDRSPGERSRTLRSAGTRGGGGSTGGHAFMGFLLQQAHAMGVNFGFANNINGGGQYYDDDDDDEEQDDDDDDDEVYLPHVPFSDEESPEDSSNGEEEEEEHEEVGVHVESSEEEDSDSDGEDMATDTQAVLAAVASSTRTTVDAFGRTVFEYYRDFQWVGSDGPAAEFSSSASSSNSDNDEDNEGI